ncbi:MAG: hypothetical protein UV61_C0024G0006 [Candidatus Gottesmanbacteria bacterium GW2011_GWB1_43_11]|uniref:Type II toxin-antitoxin system RelE/ParE family toxin n=1 Tax=Candidatus Gottesmanbacteria bacterium GW2011_GWB1_43_11 TaxID=1618446 RepID=A0A0G1CGZ0_9BACT|nr:MAG: hypothetical protein UV04_C0018G0011 [Candidatus Gottesmanbacteria bacterium GW2011_GWA2_42_16]KKS54367.1 MAG: hypothetical protein UV17_C0020G0027 [Candidatus Gottesmanbacteria bacterium GW2011_GWA1_42_26]KKS80234.1 MAG: seg [Candidatus Gottesmanbacteria bacterium GW2011_GWC1_43_10]KKS84792.1 MAG: hypothetical protein UV61_C0024G0006 [Candidatus Gottesmanbacteria bacterium GW2011_GWB1_43_11]OGG10572.1 MAG: hypothetical protein A2699_03535 [Candidatus Gottesmanbacteria bacterium RIFCSPH
MVRYQVLTHRAVKKFIDTLDRPRRARIDRFYEIFVLYGNALPVKYLKKIASRVWELRPGDVRLFLTIKGNTGYVVHAIYKKTQKTPKKDLDLAIKRIKEEVG